MVQGTKLMHFSAQGPYVYSVSADVFLIHHRVCCSFSCTNMFWLKIETKSSVMVYFLKNTKLSQVVWQRCIFGSLQRLYSKQCKTLCTWRWDMKGLTFTVDCQLLENCMKLAVWSWCSYWPGPRVRPFQSSVPVLAIQLGSSHLYNQRVKRSMGRQSAQVLHKARWFSLGWVTTHPWHVVHSESLRLQSSVTYLQGLPTATLAETDKKKKKKKKGRRKVGLRREGFWGIFWRD